MDITIRIANLPGQPPATPTATTAPTAAAAPDLPPSATPPATATTAPRPAMQSSLVAAVGRLQIRLAVPPTPGNFAPQQSLRTPATIAAAPAPIAAPVPRPVLILGAIPLAKRKSQRRTVPADQAVIPLVLPEYIEPEEVRGRVRLHAQEFEADPAAEDAETPPPITVETAASGETLDAAEPPAETTSLTPAETAEATVVSAAATETPAAEAPATDTADAAPPAGLKILVRPGPDPVAAKKSDADQAPEESPAERIERIKREDEEMRTDERKILKFANDAGKLSSMVEVVLFQNAKPLTINQIARALPGKVNPKQLRQSLRLCADRFDRGEHPIELVEIAGGWQLVVRSGFQELIETFTGAGKKRTIAGSIMETLAIIAYRQGTTKVEIETLRGINDCSPHLRQLGEMGLIANGRRTDLPGSPMGYWTTPLFMRAVGIRSLDELGQMGEFTPTEVAGLVEIEAPSDEDIAAQAAAADAEAAETADDLAAPEALATAATAETGDRDEAAVDLAIDPDAIDAAMTAGDEDDADADANDAVEADAQPGVDLFGEAVVIPVDPTDAAPPSAADPTSPAASEPAPTGKAKRTRRRRPDGL